MKLIICVCLCVCTYLNGDWRSTWCLRWSHISMQHLKVDGRCQVVGHCWHFPQYHLRPWHCLESVLNGLNSQSNVTWLTLEAGACLADVWQLRPDLQQVDWSSRHIKACWARVRGQTLLRGGQHGAQSRELMQQLSVLHYVVLVHIFVNKYIGVLQFHVKLRPISRTTFRHESDSTVLSFVKQYLLAHRITWNIKTTTTTCTTIVVVVVVVVVSDNF